MSENPADHSEASPESPRYETDEFAEKRFRGWRLVGIIMGVVMVLAIISAIVDWAVIGPLEGRMY